MRFLIVFSGVLNAVVPIVYAVAGEIKSELNACAKKSTWSKDKFLSWCANRTVSQSEIETLKNLNLCIWKAAGVVQLSPFTLVYADAAAKLAEPEKAKAIAEIVRIFAMSEGYPRTTRVTPADAAWKLDQYILYNCPQFYTEYCKDLGNALDWN